MAEDGAAFDVLLAHPGTVLIGAEVAGRIRAMATLHLLPNMTYSGRPYALVENVVTAAAQRGRGLGRAVMEEVIARARAARAYKVMLLTGAARGAGGFYAALGFRTGDKTAMTLWHDLPPEARKRVPA